ncbi:MAG TPA: glycosyltransferase family 39 protein [Rhodanobacteraceae bacterium]
MPSQKSSTAGDHERVWTIAFVIVLLIAAALRILPLGHEAIDGDECFSVRVAIAPLSQAWDIMRQDLVHPPLYYLLLKGWVAIAGTSPFALRLLSLLSGLGAVALTFVLARRLSLRAPYCVLAALLVALNDIQIYYSEQVRSYSFFAALVLVFALAVLWVDETARNRVRLGARHWVVLAGLAVLLCYTHYVGALYVAAAWLCLIASPHDRPFKLKVTACFALAALLFLPWLLGEIDVYRSKGLEENLAWENLATFYDLRALFALFTGMPEFRGGTMLALGVFCVLAVAAMRQRSGPAMPPAAASRMQAAGRITLTHGWASRNETAAWLVLALALVPPVLLFIAGSPPFSLRVFAYRHLLPSLAPAILLLAAGTATLAEWPGAFGRIARIGVPLVLIVLQIVPTWPNTIHARRVPFDQIAQLLNSDLAGVPAYTTYAYGIGAPVNYYAGTERVATLPANFETDARRIALLFRPALPDEADQAKRVMDGWNKQRTVYFTNGRNSRYGTEVDVLTKP